MDAGQRRRSQRLSDRGPGQGVGEAGSSKQEQTAEPGSIDVSGNPVMFSFFLFLCVSSSYYCCCNFVIFSWSLLIFIFLSTGP
jgi:hypothetical protein